MEKMNVYQVKGTMTKKEKKIKWLRIKEKTLVASSGTFNILAQHLIYSLVCHFTFTQIAVQIILALQVGFYIIQKWNNFGQL